MKNRYKAAIQHELNRIKNYVPGTLSDNDIQYLPEIVKKYICYTGFAGKEKILNFRACFKGGIRFKPGEEFMPLKSVQYNFMDIHSRVFYIEAKKKGIPVAGLHIYRDAKALFKIKVLRLFTVVDASGPKMDQGETVTVLNDMFFIAPGSLIDKRIQWEEVDSLTVKAIFTNKNITVSAFAFFTGEGRLINFISYDRFETSGKEYYNYPWETPVTEYKEVNGYFLPLKAKLIFKRPEGDFCYGEFELDSIDYNCSEIK